MMEKQFVRDEMLHGNEMMPLDAARFLDTLEPEYEQQWKQMLTSASGLGMRLNEFTASLWNDEAFPQVIRDRAMLLLVGKKRSIDEWKGPYTFDVLFGGKKQVLNQLEIHSEAFKMWIDQAMAYGDVIDNAMLYALSYEYFTSGYWDTERFERTLEQFDPNEVQGVWQDPLDEYGYVHPLPYIGDILRGASVDESNEKMQRWAREKYDAYAQNFIVNESVLPSWLQDLPRGAVMDVAHREYIKSKDNETLPANVVAAYEEYFAWLCNGRDYAADDELYKEGSSIIRHLGEFSQRAILDYLKFRYERTWYPEQVAYGLTKADEEAICAHINVPLPDDIVDLANRLAEMRVADAERRAKQTAEFRANGEARKQEEIARRQKREADAAKLSDAKSVFLRAHRGGDFIDD